MVCRVLVNVFFYWGQTDFFESCEGDIEEVYLDSWSELVILKDSCGILLVNQGKEERMLIPRTKKVAPNFLWDYFSIRRIFDRGWNWHVCEWNLCKCLLILTFSDPNSTRCSKLGKVIYHDRIGDVFPTNPSTASAHGTSATHLVIACVLKKIYIYSITPVSPILLGNVVGRIWNNILHCSK